MHDQDIVIWQRCSAIQFGYPDDIGLLVNICFSSISDGCYVWVGSGCHDEDLALTFQDVNRSLLPVVDGGNFFPNP